MATIDAAKSGSFKIGGDLAVHRLGFGAMRITGKGIWGEPDDRGEALRTLRRVPELGINLIDTADSYGPEVSERLIREALSPYKGIVIATKGGLQRPGPDRWVSCGKPEYLRQQVSLSLRLLGIERIDLWQLHRIDPRVPRIEQFATIAAMQREGLIRHVGLSNVNVEEIKAAQEHFEVATVQSLFNITNRSSDAVVDYCTRQGIGFIPWYRWREAWRGPARRSIPSPTATMPPPARSRWRGCYGAVPSCCPSPAPARSSIWKKTSQA